MLHVSFCSIPVTNGTLKQSWCHRFDYNQSFGGKISKQIEYTEHLNLRPYMTSQVRSAYREFFEIKNWLWVVYHYCNIIVTEILPLNPTFTWCWYNRVIVSVTLETSMSIVPHRPGVSQVGEPCSCLYRPTNLLDTKDIVF